MLELLMKIRPLHSARSISFPVGEPEQVLEAALAGVRIALEVEVDVARRGLGEEGQAATRLVR
jgi:hypothetical protein